jgi:hypothetical protein
MSVSFLLLWGMKIRLLYPATVRNPALQRLREAADQYANLRQPAVVISPYRSVQTLAKTGTFVR